MLNRVARKLAPTGVKRAKLLAEMAANRKTFVAGNRKAMESDAWPMRPERILADLRAVLPRDAILCTDVGWNKNGMAQQYPIYTPGSVFTPGGFATMGFGSPAALGAKVALPDKVVVALIGDGGFGQNPAALATAFEDDIAVVWVIMNNHAFGTIAGLEMAHYGTTFAHGVREGRQVVVARLRGDRPGLRRRRRQGRAPPPSSSRRWRRRSSRSARSSSTST